ncbi:MAG TPA: GNAT family N-acyltransferase [Candidatus Angelobacter sp.]|nr:GNAT family N-acyltransferase [Candidatus Angelobacter sp.]
MQTANALSHEVDQRNLAGASIARRYRAYLATTEEERRAAYRLRFRIFNLELHEGLESAFETGEDRDEFDAVCDHIIVEDAFTGNVVGTYRLQTGTSAARKLGYYSAREFDFTPYEALGSQIIELGRACIHPEHRKYEVLMLLWKAIVRYACDHGGRYLIGCCSLNSQDRAAGSAVYQTLASTLAPEGLRTSPRRDYRFELSDCQQEVRPPKLLRAYLSLGANICGEPAIDREFRTIDFLTLMDLNNLAPSVRTRLGM